MILMAMHFAPPINVLQFPVQFSIEPRVPQLSAEQLDVAVFSGTALGNKQRVDASLRQPAAHAVSNELQPVIAVDVRGQPRPW